MRKPEIRVYREHKSDRNWRYSFLYTLQLAHNSPYSCKHRPIWQFCSKIVAIFMPTVLCTKRWDNRPYTSDLFHILAFATSCLSVPGTFRPLLGRILYTRLHGHPKSSSIHHISFNWETQLNEITLLRNFYTQPSSTKLIDALFSVTPD